MKDKFKYFSHNSSVVFSRYLPNIVWYSLGSGIMIWLLSKGFISFWTIGVAGYNIVMLLYSIFEMIVDYLDCAVNIRGVSKLRQKHYENKIIREKNRREKALQRKTILMPYQTTSFTAMPQVMTGKVNHLDR